MQLTINGTSRTFARPVTTVADLVRVLGLEGKRIALERNGAIVPKSRHADTPLADGDRLEIVGAVGGG
jgi:sulfur carrier protein